MAPPANDNFASPTVISTTLPATLTSQTTLDATKEASEINIGWAGDDQSIWYTFTPSSSGYYQFKLFNKLRNGDSPFNFGEMYMMMRKGVSSLADFDAFVEPDADVVFPLVSGGSITATSLPDPNRPAYAVRYLTSGVTYHLKIFSPTRTDNNFNGYTALFDLEVSLLSLSPPANDDFANAIALSTTLPNSRTGDTMFDATGEVGEGNLQGGVNPSVWYKFTPTVTQEYQFKIPNASLNFVGTGTSSWGGVYLTIYDATVDSVEDVRQGAVDLSAYTDITSSTDDAVGHVAMNAGTTYYIRVSQYISDRALNYGAVEFDLEWDVYTPPPPPDFPDPPAEGPGVENMSTIGATFEADEETNGEGWEGVWAKLDLSSYDGNVDIDIQLTATVGSDAEFAPYMDTFKVVDPTFDPDAPDFTKLDFVSGQYIGDGEIDVSGTITLPGGVGVTSGNASINGVFYLFFTDYNFTAYGNFAFIYSYAAPPVSFAAIDFVNPESTTAFINGDYVQETYEDEAYTIPAEQMVPLLTWTAPADMAPGLYQIKVQGKFGANPDFYDETAVLVKRNGLPAANYKTIDNTPNSGSPDYSWTGGRDIYLPGQRYIAPSVLVLPNDVIDVIAWVPTGSVAAQISRVIFKKVQDVVQGNQFDIVRVDENPLGFSDSLNKGLLEEESSFNTDIDLAADSNGNVYALCVESRSGDPDPPSAYVHYFWLKKWDGASWTTTQLGPISWGSENPTGGCSIRVDPNTDDVYVAVWSYAYDVGGLSSGYVGGKGFYWHVFKSTDEGVSFTELGTGQANNSSMSDLVSNMAQLDMMKPDMAIDASGNVFVMFQELIDDSTPSNGSSERVYVWKWNGTTWSDMALPQPSTSLWRLQGNVTTGGLAFSYGIVMGDATGGTSRPMVVYSWDDFSGNAYLRTCEWNGTSWDIYDFQNDDLDPYGYLTSNAQTIIEPRLAHDGTHVLMSVRAGNASYHNVWRWKSDHTWEVYPGTTRPIDTCYTIAGGQPGMCVGPDGKPYLHIRNNNAMGSTVIVKPEDIGTGGWINASDQFNPQTGQWWDGTFCPIASDGTNIYILVAQQQVEASPSFYEWINLHVWRAVPVTNFDYSWEPL